MNISEVGEFGLIQMLLEIVEERGLASKEQLLMGIGDDAAAWQGESAVELATTDTLIQDVHFTLELTTWRELGWKVLAVNLSDIAAMGGVPEYSLVSLALPADITVDSVKQLYHGMADVASEFGVSIAGGNVSRAPLVMVTISVIGKAGRENGFMLTRSAASPGEMVAVTGYLGSSAAGLRMLKEHLRFDEETERFLKTSHLRPRPRIWEGQFLLRHGVRAAIDISDGLVSDLSKLCKASGVEAEVRAHKVPVHPLVKAAFRSDCVDSALFGGEDYELLFTAPAQTVERIKEELPCPITTIGKVMEGEPGRVGLVDEKGNTVERDKSGWNHFPRNP